jgi:hypothetical protein
LGCERHNFTRLALFHSPHFGEGIENRKIFFIAKNQLHEIYETYEIHFTIAEKDRGGEFEQGYEHFFNSIKIVP